MVISQAHADEFDTDALRRADAVAHADLSDRIATACRGSANPAGLAWLAEALQIDVLDRVVDLGGGLGGPAAWIARRYLCHVTTIDPAAGACAGARRLFTLGVVQGDAAVLPFRPGSFDCALMLGTLSVLENPGVALGEAARVARKLGILDYCSTEPVAVRSGGSVFRTEAELVGMVSAQGWMVSQHCELTLPTPESWREVAAATDTSDAQRVPSEREVISAIGAQRIVPVVLVAGLASNPTP